MVVVTRETDEILQHINLAADRNSLAGNLSYGKHRSLEISMALATGADLVMLDEPAAGMSVDETHYAVKLIRRLTDGKTMVLSNTTWMWSSPWPTGSPFASRHHSGNRNARRYQGESRSTIRLTG